MTRTPDEIKKGLADNIPIHYHPGDLEPRLTPLMMVDLEDLHADALALIQQLEGMLIHMNQLRDAAAGRALNMEERVRQLEAERDAAVKDIYEMEKYITDACEWCDGVECERLCMMHLTERPGFKWRGVQKEE